LSAEQIESLRAPSTKKGGSVRELLARFLGLTDMDTPKNAINLDLYIFTLKHGQVSIITRCLAAASSGTCTPLPQIQSSTTHLLQDMGLAADKLSGLFSIMKEVHKRSVEGRMPIERSFALFKSLMLSHSVQRPPYSIGLFTFPEYTAILEWGLDTYYRHYKLYQYAFTDR
jgi:hypothetical protein